MTVFEVISDRPGFEHPIILVLQENVDDFVLLNYDLKSIILNLMLTGSMINSTYLSIN